MRPARFFELLVAVASVVLTGATAFTLRPADALVGALVLVGIGWGGIAFAVDALSRRRLPPRPTSRIGSVTTVVRLGAESDEVARPSIILAAQAGPTVVLSTRDRELLHELAAIVDVGVNVAPTLEAALADAVPSITTDAMLFVSASAFPVADACVAAAGHLRDDVGWAVGSAPSFNADRFAPPERELLRARARSQLRAAGADVWEPDATIVRTDLVRATPFEPGVPWGAWMRAQRVPRVPRHRFGRSSGPTRCARGRARVLAHGSLAQTRRGRGSCGCRAHGPDARPVGGRERVVA